MCPLRALSIRQPYAELILRGIKTVEYRSRATRIVGERFYIHAGKSPVRKIWSRDLAGAGALPPPLWMIELAEQVGMIEADAQGGLPTGVIVGSAVIEKVVCRGEPRVRPVSFASEGEHKVRPCYEWHLTGVERATRLRKPKGHPQPVWFNPF